MVVQNNRPKSKKPDNNEPKSVPLPLIIGGGVLVVFFFLFMYHTYISPLYGQGQRKVERVPPRPGDPDVAPYNTKEWQENTKPGQRMPGVPPRDLSQPATPR
jgi:hypothetical protein